MWWFRYACRTKDWQPRAGITVSSAQYKLARKRVEDAGLGDRVNICLADYRDVCGRPFDKVVSIEMFEAVGREYWGVFSMLVRASLSQATGCSYKLLVFLTRAGVNGCVLQDGSASTCSPAEFYLPWLRFGRRSVTVAMPSWCVRSARSALTMFERWTSGGSDFGELRRTCGLKL